MEGTILKELISIKRLMNDEFVALGAIQILSIPHYSIINNGKSEYEFIVERYKHEINNMLSELFQIFKMNKLRTDNSAEFSYELLWKSSPVQNQPFNASIELFVIVRVIEQQEVFAIEKVNDILNVIQSTLAAQKFEYIYIESSKLLGQLSQIDTSSICSIVKDEQLENLQNQYVPFCYSFDRIPKSVSDLSKIVNALINYPNCAISFQLIPVTYDYDEMNEVDKQTQLLETLYKGVSDQSIGNISFTMADSQAKKYKYYSERKNTPLFSFNILIIGNEKAVTSLSTQVFGQLSYGSENQASLRIITINPHDISFVENFYPSPWAINEFILNNERNCSIWDSGQVSNLLYRLPYIITGEEAIEFFRLPIAGEKLGAGFNVNESGKSNKTYNENLINSGDLIIGKLKSSIKNDSIGISLNDLTKHMLVVGTPGSGKTTFSVGLLDRLWKENKIPFIVIEPAKNEYRALIKSIPDIQIFTPGKNSISPFVFNPFVPPKNVKLETYKSTLKTAFAAGVSMSTPLDKIFEESINNCYSDFRWLDNYTKDNLGRTFNISDFIKCFQKTFEDIGYTGDAKNIGRAGVVRLNGLVNLFDNYHTIPIEDLMSKPTIIELAAIENSDEKALIIALLLLSILAYVNANFTGVGKLKNVILLEEAHVLLDADTQSGQGDANPSAIAQKLIKRMLAEIRSYGVGLIIADQSPRKVTTDVVALTDIKIVFRLVESIDKQIIGDSSNMTENQVIRMSKLKPGEAFIYFNKLDEPEEIIMPDYRLENSIEISLSDDDIKNQSSYWLNQMENLRPYPECKLIRFCEKGCNYNTRVLSREVARRIFVKNFDVQNKSFNQITEVFSKISRLIKAELNDEVFTPDILSCAKVHLWRKIKSNTQIQVLDIQIENSLRK